MTPPSADERGAVTVELVLIVPAVVLVIALMTAGWRIWSVRAQADDAAGAGARAASLASDAPSADAAARAAVAAELATVASHCVAPQVQVDVSAFTAPAGATGEVRVDVHCEVGFRDLVLAQSPLSADGHGSSRIDSYRERKP